MLARSLCIVLALLASAPASAQTPTSFRVEPPLQFAGSQELGRALGRIRLGATNYSIIGEPASNQVHLVDEALLNAAGSSGWTPTWTLVPGVLPTTLQTVAAFGASIEVLGDLDGDGEDELAIGAPESVSFGQSTSFASAGAVFVFSGALIQAAAVGSLVPHPTASAANPLTIESAGAEFGYSITTLSDAALPGAPAPFIVGAPGHSGELGRAYFVRRQASGTLLVSLVISTPLADLGGSPPRFGQAVRALAVADLDVMQQPISGFAVGIPGYDIPSPLDIDSGAVRIFKVEGTTITETGLAEGACGSRFGEEIEETADFSGDGHPDLLVGAPMGAAGTGLVAIYSPFNVLSGIPVPGGGTAGSQYGSSLRSLGDVDGDGSIEIVVGAPQANSGCGLVEVISLVPNAGMAPPATVILSEEGTVPGDEFGDSLAIRDDSLANGNFVVGVPGFGSSAGAAQLMRPFARFPGTGDDLQLAIGIGPAGITSAPQLSSGPGVSEFDLSGGPWTLSLRLESPGTTLWFAPQLYFAQIVAPASVVHDPLLGTAFQFASPQPIIPLLASGALVPAILPFNSALSWEIPFAPGAGGLLIQGATTAGVGPVSNGIYAATDSVLLRF